LFAFLLLLRKQTIKERKRKGKGKTKRRKVARNQARNKENNKNTKEKEFVFCLSFCCVSCSLLFFYRLKPTATLIKLFIYYLFYNLIEAVVRR